jgi:peptidoglycan hydrolase FlgJ
MSLANTIPARQAITAYSAAAKAKPGTKEHKAHTAAQGFEAVFLQNMLESMVSGLGTDGPLGSGQAGGGAWRGFLVDEMSKGMSKQQTLGIAPQVYREMMRIQESSGQISKQVAGQASSAASKAVDSVQSLKGL